MGVAAAAVARHFPRLPRGLRPMNFALAILLLAAPIKSGLETVDIVHVDKTQSNSVEVVSQERTGDGRELTVVFRPKSGKDQFTADFDFGLNKFDRVKIVVEGAKK